MFKWRNYICYPGSVISNSISVEIEKASSYQINQKLKNMATDKLPLQMLQNLHIGDLGFVNVIVFLVGYVCGCLYILFHSRFLTLDGVSVNNYERKT